MFSNRELAGIARRRTGGRRPFWLAIFLLGFSFSGFEVHAQVSTNDAVISGGSFIGNDGGVSLGDDFTLLIDPASINGLNASGSMIISNGTFVGGDGDLFSFAVHSGGSGLQLTDGTTAVHGGNFEGGSAASAAYADGFGIQLNVSAASNGVLSIFGGTITDGVSIAVGENGTAEYHTTTSAAISGGVEKSGSGTLLIKDWQAGTLQELEVAGGSVLFTNRYVLGAGGSVSLSGASAVLVASNGLAVAGQFNGVSGSTVQVYSDMTLSGTLSGAFDVELMSMTNSITLQDGYALGNTTFYGTNSAADSLQIETAGTYNAGSGSLGMGTTFREFEHVQLSDSGADIWELTTSDITRTSFTVDGGVGGGDMLAMAVAGTYAQTDFNTNLNTGFEVYGLSSFDDTWTAASNDVVLAVIDGRSGEDALDFGAYKVASGDIGAGRLYQNFEGALLAGGTDIWSSTNDYSQLDYLDADNGSWTLSYADETAGVTTNAQQMGAAAFYRNFQGVELTAFDDTWEVTDGENGLALIDAGGGTNTLQLGNSVTDSRAENIGAGELYQNFQQVDLQGGADTWTVTSGDTGLFWVDGGSAVDTLSHAGESAGTFSSVDMGANGLYRSFEQVVLTAGTDTWNVSTNDAAAGLQSVNAGAGADTLSYADYEGTVASFSKAAHVDGLYTGFETVELTGGNDQWDYANTDGSLKVDAGGGTANLLNVDSFSLTGSEVGDYSGFETLRLVNGATLTSTDNASLGVNNLQLQNGATLVLGDTLLALSGSYTQDGSSMLTMNAQTNLASARLMANQVTFSPGTQIRFLSETPADYSVVNRYTNRVAQASANLNVGSLDTLLQAVSPFEIKNWYEEDNSLFAIFDRRSLTDAANGFNVPNGSKLKRILTEVDTLKSDEASRMVNFVFAGNNSVVELAKAYDRTVALPRTMSHQRQSMLRTIGLRTGERRMLLSAGGGARGPAGPPRNQKGSSLWMKGYSAIGTAAEDGDREGYDLSGRGAVIGLDRTFGELVLGVAGGTFNQTMTMDSSGSYSGAGTHATVYASHGIEGWFFETSASLSSASLAFESDGAFEVDADYTATDLIFRLGTGYIMRNERSSWTPEVGLVVNMYSQDAVTDNSVNSVPVELDALSQMGFQMQLGLTGAFRRNFIGRELLTQLKVRWMNSLGIVDEEIDFQLSGGGDSYQMPLLTPAKSLIEIGVGTQLRMNRSFSLLLGFDYEFGGGYSANRLNAGLRYNF